MPQSIDRNQVQRLIDQEDAVLAEVLPRAEYDWAHLAGAIHLPLKGWDPADIQTRLDPAQAVIVYCHDHQCDMSPRAAWRLESLGYQHVYDYVAGKADWLSFGLPHEGTAVLASQALSTDVPTCSLHDRLADVRAPLEASRYGMLVVLNADGVVMGRLDRRALAHDANHTGVDQLMREGPTTVRPSEELEPLLDRMRHADIDAVLVTSSDGRLLGLLERHRGEQLAKEPA